MTRWSVHHADVLDALVAMPSDSFDASLSDPPYGLGTHQPTVDELVAYLTGADLDTGGCYPRHPRLRRLLGPPGPRRVGDEQGSGGETTA